MPHYTHETDDKGQIHLVPVTILVEGLNGHFIEETFEEFHGVYTRRRLASHDEWQVGDYVYLPSKDLFGFVTKINKIMLSVSNPEIRKTHKVRKGNLLLISRLEK